MALLTWPSIITGLDMESALFRLRRFREQTRDSNSTPYEKDLAPAVWGAETQSIPYAHAEAEQLMAQIEAMQDEIGAFYLHNYAVQFPQSDPNGTIYGVSTPTIHSVNADGRRLSITDLPNGYVLTRGDALAVDYLSPAQRARYVVVDATVTADGSGVTAEFQVSPAIRVGTAAGDSVNLIRPAAIMKMDPGSVSCKTETGTTSRVTFTATEDPSQEVA